MAGTKLNKWSLLSSSVVVAAGLATPAFAQDGPTADEIVVTAQRVEEVLRDVPVSVAAMDGERLEELGIDDLRDFTGQVPNLFINNFNGRPDTVRIFIRGLGQNDVSLTQDPSVALYIDNVYVGSAIGSSFDSLDLERVEILRGPQGTLYGRNATGGAVNLISRRPQLEEFNVYGSTTFGNYNLRQARIGVNIPIGEDFAANLVYGVTERDGWVQNDGLGRDWSEQDRENFRGALRFSPSSSFEVNYSYDWSHVQDTGPFTGPSVFTNGTPTPAGGPTPNIIGGVGYMFLGAPYPNPATGPYASVAEITYSDAAALGNSRPDSATALQEVVPVDSTIYGHSLSIEWNLSDALTLRSITGYRSIESDFRGDYMPTAQGQIGVLNLGTFAFSPGVDFNADGTPDLVLPPGSVGGQGIVTEFESLSQEIQALGTVDALGSTIRYVAGVYYYEQEGSNFQTSTFLTPRGSASAAIDDDSIALFTEVTFFPHAFNDQLEISLGARYSEDTRTAERINESSYAYAALGGFTPANCADPTLGPVILAQPENMGVCDPSGVVQGASYSRDFDNFSPSLSVTWNFTDTVNAYFRYAQGYKTGGTSERSATPALFSVGYEPEEVTSYEIGLKGLFFNRRLAFNMAAFYMELDAFQTSVQTGTTPGDRDFIGLDGNTFQGIEADAQFAITDYLSLVASVGILDTEVGQTTVTYSDSLGAPVTANLISVFPYAPEQTITLGVNYERPVNADYTLTGALNYAYQSSVETSLNVYENTDLDSHGVLDGSLALTRTYNDSDDTFTLRIWGRNILNEDYRIVDNQSFAFIGAQRSAEWGEPATYGVTLSASF
jgi:iron complex outermembrane receptor protein